LATNNLTTTIVSELSTIRLEAGSISLVRAIKKINPIYCMRQITAKKFTKMENDGFSIYNRFGKSFDEDYPYGPGFNFLGDEGNSFGNRFRG